MKNLWTKHWQVILLGFIIVVAAGFRFYNLNWDEGHFFHPDERNIVHSSTELTYPFNPHFFAYGSLPIYFYRLIVEIWPRLGANWVDILVAGRATSALLSVGVVVLVYFIGQRLYRLEVGLLAAIFTALSVGLIQVSHFLTTETLLMFLALLTTFFAWRIFKTGRLKDYLFCSMVIGFGLAAKTVAASFLTILVVAFVMHLIKSKDWRNQIRNLVIGFFVVAVVAFIFAPYNILDFKDFWQSMQYESGVVIGKLRVVYTLQFIGTVPYFYQLKNLVKYILGYPLGIIVLVSWVYIIIKAIRERRPQEMLLLAWTIPYFLYIGSWYVKFIRYSVLIVPFLNLYAAILLVDLWQYRQRLVRIITILIGVATIGWSLIYSVAFMNVYRQSDPRISASRWIYDNIPEKSVVYTEHWDEGLPVPIGGQYKEAQFVSEPLTIYEPDNNEKLEYYSTKLSQGDYITIASSRLYGTLIHLSDKYPLTSKYYQKLFSGELGYDKVAEFSLYPQILGYKLNDDAAEETFQVFDHPKVLIFKNNRKFTSVQIKNILSN